jgi:hypothetical protein
MGEMEMTYSDTERSRLLADRKTLSTLARQIKVPMIMFSSLPLGLILGSVEIVDCYCREDIGEYAYVLARPERFEHFLKAANQPQPRFWLPRFE